MSAQTLISRLEGVRAVGRDRWVARCPAHDDRGPSLSITERDGRILFHCFAGCDAESVLNGAGLRWCDVLPQGDTHVAGRSQPLPAALVLEACAREITVSALLAQELGMTFGSARLVEAGSRLNAALTLIGHEPASLKAARRAMR